MSMTLMLTLAQEVVTEGGAGEGLGWSDTTIVLPPLWVPVVGSLIPVLTALVAKYRAPGQRLIYSVLGIVFAAVLATVAALLDDIPDTVGALATAFGISVATSVIAYLTVWSGAGRGTNGINETLARGGVV